MNRPERFVEAYGVGGLVQSHANMLRILKGTVEVLAPHETWQFSDYSAVNAAMFDVAEKERTRAERFPVDCRKAIEMGARLAEGTSASDALA
jgi:hypothetical protein